MPMAHASSRDRVAICDQDCLRRACCLWSMLLLAVMGKDAFVAVVLMADSGLKIKNER